jgi:predicted nuclease of restriction endonuclease-like (RecB) superfamily
MANDDIVGEVECDFAFEKEVARDGFVVEPVEYRREWVQTAVETSSISRETLSGMVVGEE